MLIVRLKNNEISFSFGKTNLDLEIGERKGRKKIHPNIKFKKPNLTFVRPQN
jgi:hypothetical protein